MYGMRLQVTEEQLKKDIRSGMSLSQMAEKYECSVSSVHRCLKSYGVTYSDCRAKIEKEEAIEMLKNGASNDAIAERFECSKSAVNDFIKRHKLQNIRKNHFRRIEEELRQKSVPNECVVCKPTENVYNFRLSQATVVNKTAQKCLYGGKCGSCDCCDKLYITGKARRRDKDDPTICYDFIRATRKEKEEFRKHLKSGDADVLIY